MPADYFLKIDGIEGESQDDSHKNEIQLVGFTWGESQEGAAEAGGGATAGKVSMHNFSFKMESNKASPKLFLACANGQAIKEATLTCRKAGESQQEYLKWKIEEVIVASFETSSNEGNGTAMPTDKVELGFSRISIEYKPQKEDGTLDAAVTAGYDLKKMKKQ